MPVADETFDAIIIGAGAAGLMCALTAGQRGRKVLLLEHTDKAGAKILISGGGRCNFTNLATRPTASSRATRISAPRRCAATRKRDFIALVRRHGIAFHEKTLGQLFCDGSARAIVAMLLAECAGGGVDLRLGQSVTDVTRTDRFHVETSSGRFSAPALVLATGGPLHPEDGRHGLQLRHRAALRLAHHANLAGPRAVEGRRRTRRASMRALPACRWRRSPRSKSRASARASCSPTAAFPGPAILQISSYWRPGLPITLDLLPGLNATAFLLERKQTRAKASPQTVLAEVMPARLAQAMTAALLPPGEVANEMANLSDRTLAAFAERLKRWQFLPDGSEGYAKAEVTLGGIDTRDLSSKTMAATKVDGLYAIGEAVDVTGWLGGYNFQWAWSSGWSAGQAI